MIPTPGPSFESWNASDLPLEAERLTDKISFGADGIVSFHWSDFREACRLWQTRIAIEPGLRKDYERRLQEMQKLRALPIWIRSGKTTTQTNLFDLYEGFICDQLWQGDTNLPHPQYDISLISPSGPFKKMPVTNCFNLQTYRDFVMVFLLQDKLPRRDFRLRVKSKVLAEYGPNFSEACLVELEQISASGLLFRVSGSEYFGRMVPHQQVRLLFKTSFLTNSSQVSEFRHEVAQWNNNPFYTHDKTEAFVFDCKETPSNSRFDGEETRECFLRISFDTISRTNGPQAQRLKAFVKAAQHCILEMLQQQHRAA